MKRFIITSICTLVLSLLGAFGVSQNSQAITTNPTPAPLAGNITNIEDQSLPSDNQTNAAAVTSPAAENTDNNTVISGDTNNTDSVRKNIAVGVNNNAALQKVLAKSNSGNHYGWLNNKHALYYKNVNLSKCKTTRDVVNTLRKNGFTGVTMKSIKNISSLRDILAYIQGIQTGNTGNNPSPTTAPVPSGDPVPTAAPVPTVKPVPTAVPVPTVNPAPTTTPAPTVKPAPTPTTAPAPTVKPAPTTAPTSAPTGISSFSSEVLRLVNIERAKAGLSAYTTNTAIKSAADKRAQEIKQSFSHTRPDGSSFFTVLGEYGIAYRAAGENIAYGQRTPQEVVNAWMNSAGHRANILNLNFNKIGIGVFESNGVIYWVQEFTN